MDRVTLRKPITCPWCKRSVNDVIGVLTPTPKPQAGDAFLCECEMISIWLGSSELRKPTYDEAKEAAEKLIGGLIVSLLKDDNG